MNDEGNPYEPPTIPGKVVVVGMFAFAILLTGTLWIYTRLHNAPFIPLRRALATEYGRPAAPRVEGGRHRKGPLTLRVVMTVDFDPSAQDAPSRDRVAAIDRRIIELARQHVDLAQYEILEINLIQVIPEGNSPRRELKLKVSELPDSPGSPNASAPATPLATPPPS